MLLTGMSTPSGRVRVLSSSCSLFCACDTIVDGRYPKSRNRHELNKTDLSQHGTESGYIIKSMLIAKNMPADAWERYAPLVEAATKERRAQGEDVRRVRKPLGEAT